MSGKRVKYVQSATTNLSRLIEFASFNPGRSVFTDGPRKRTSARSFFSFVRVPSHVHYVYAAEKVKDEHVGL